MGRGSWGLLRTTSPAPACPLLVLPGVSLQKLLLNQRPPPRQISPLSAIVEPTTCDCSSYHRGNERDNLLPSNVWVVIFGPLDINATASS